MIKKGTYISLSVEHKSIFYILYQLKDKGFINLVDIFQTHVTLINSLDENPDIQVRKFSSIANPIKFSIFTNKYNELNLILLLDSTELLAENSFYKEKYNLIEDHPSYLPHITLSYDLERSIPFPLTRKEISSLIENMNIHFQPIEISNPHLSVKISRESN